MKQKYLDVASYTEEFHKLCMRAKIQKEEPIKVVRYLSGLEGNIQVETSLWNPTTIKKCH